MYMYVFVYIYIYIYMYLSVFIYIYIYIHTYIQADSPQSGPALDAELRSAAERVDYITLYDIILDHRTTIVYYSML